MCIENIACLLLGFFLGLICFLFWLFCSPKKQLANGVELNFGQILFLSEQLVPESMAAFKAAIEAEGENVEFEFSNGCIPLVFYEAMDQLIEGKLTAKYCCLHLARSNENIEVKRKAIKPLALMLDHFNGVLLNIYDSKKINRAYDRLYKLMLEIIFSNAN